LAAAGRAFASRATASWLAELNPALSGQRGVEGSSSAWGAPGDLESMDTHGEDTDPRLPHWLRPVLASARLVRDGSEGASSTRSGSGASRELRVVVMWEESESEFALSIS
jgi:hypothetical protein